MNEERSEGDVGCRHGLAPDQCATCNSDDWEPPELVGVDVVRLSLAAEVTRLRDRVAEVERDGEELEASASRASQYADATNAALDPEIRRRAKAEARVEELEGERTENEAKARKRWRGAFEASLEANKRVEAAEAERDQLRDRMAIIREALEEMELFCIGEPLTCPGAGHWESEEIRPGIYQGRYVRTPACETCPACRIREALGLPLKDDEEEGDAPDRK